MCRSDFSGGAKAAKHVPRDTSRVPVRALLHKRAVLGGVPMIRGGLPEPRKRKRKIGVESQALPSLKCRPRIPLGLSSEGSVEEGLFSTMPCDSVRVGYG